MKVADLQRVLSGLSQLLRDAEGKKVAGELEKFREGLEPFKELTLADVLALAGRAEERSSTEGGQPKGRVRRPQAADAEKVRQAVGEVLALAERATQPEISFAMIAAEVGQIAKRWQLGVADAVQLAREVGIATSLKTKKAALEAIQRMVEGRKENAQRVDAIVGPSPPMPPA